MLYAVYYISIISLALNHLVGHTRRGTLGSYLALVTNKIACLNKNWYLTIEMTEKRLSFFWLLKYKFLSVSIILYSGDNAN